MSDFIKREPCDLCGKEPWGRVRTNGAGKTVFFCWKCPVPFSIATGGRVNKVFLKGYGSVSEKRIGELKRRVIVPKTTDSDGNYVVGRRMENGRLNENKEPDY